MFCFYQLHLGLIKCYWNSRKFNSFIYCFIRSKNFSVLRKIALWSEFFYLKRFVFTNLIDLKRNTLSETKSAICYEISMCFEASSAKWNEIFDLKRIVFVWTDSKTFCSIWNEIPDLKQNIHEIWNENSYLKRNLTPSPQKKPSCITHFNP